MLIDLTTVTTSMTVNQLRGRSIRLDADEPQKLANNWDVVCMAPEFSKGLDDYLRFIAKHKTLFGITDDGAIEKGVGHVHPAFTELKPEGLEGSTSLLNTEMLARAGRRDEVRELWKIGQPYSAEPIRALETSPLGGSGGFPPFKGAREQWNDASLALAIGKAVLLSLCDAELLGHPGMLHVGPAVRRLRAVVPGTSSRRRGGAVHPGVARGPRSARPASLCDFAFRPRGPQHVAVGDPARRLSAVTSSAANNAA